MALRFGGDEEYNERDPDDYMREREIEEERLAELPAPPDLPYFQTNDPQTPGSNATDCCRALSAEIKSLKGLPSQDFISHAEDIILRAFNKFGYRRSAFGDTDNGDSQPAFWRCLTSVEDESDKKHLSDFIAKTLEENPKY